MREGIGDRRQKQEVQPPMDPVLMRLDDDGADADADADDVIMIRSSDN